MRTTLKVLMAQLAFILAISSPAMATRCCTGQPNCEGMWTATADVFPVVCFRLYYANGREANFCLEGRQTRQVKVSSGDTVSWWAKNVPVPDNEFSTPV